MDIQIFNNDYSFYIQPEISLNIKINSVYVFLLSRQYPEQQKGSRAAISVDQGMHSTFREGKK